LEKKKSALHQAGDVAKAVECLLSKYEILSSSPVLENKTMLSSTYFLAV
jgi:hypothetical protein